MSTGINGKLKIMNDSGEQRLINYLFSSYNPRLRPVLRTSDVVTVTFGISLHQIIDVVQRWLPAYHYINSFNFLPILRLYVIES